MNNKNVPETLFYLIGYLLYVAYRTLYLLKVLVPEWTRRTVYFLADDLDTMKRVYAGNNVRIVHPESSPVDVNAYHLRYKDSERGN